MLDKMMMMEKMFWMNYYYNLLIINYYYNLFIKNISYKFL